MQNPSEYNEQAQAAQNQMQTYISKYSSFKPTSSKITYGDN